MGAFRMDTVARVLAALDNNYDPADVRNDAGETASFTRALEYVETRVREKAYPELMALKIIPIKGGVPEDAASFVWRMWDWAGMAKVIANYSDDLPRVDVKAGEQIIPIRSIGASYAYALQELRESRKTGMPLDVIRAQLARRAHMNLFEKILTKGDSKVGLTGLLNHPNVPTIAPATIVGTWTTATSDQILSDLHIIANAVVTGSNGTHIPDTIGVPVNRYSLIATKKMNANTETTVLKEFLQNTPYIKNVFQWHQLDTGTAGGAPMAIVMKRDPEVLEGILPIEYEALPPQPKDLQFNVPTHGRIGGVVVYQPMAMRYVTGI